MLAFDQSLLVNALCNNCGCTAFAPALTYSLNTSTKVLTVTDASVFDTGDGLAAINIVVTSIKTGLKVYAKITTAAGNVTPSLSALDISAGINILATVVTTGKCVGALTVYNAANPAGATTGSLGNKLIENENNGGGGTANVENSAAINEID